MDTPDFTPNLDSPVVIPEVAEAFRSEECHKLMHYLGGQLYSAISEIEGNQRVHEGAQKAACLIISIMATTGHRPSVSYIDGILEASGVEIPKREEEPTEIPEEDIPECFRGFQLGEGKSEGR